MFLSSESQLFGKQNTCFLILPEFLVCQIDVCQTQTPWPYQHYYHYMEKWKYVQLNNFFSNNWVLLVSSQLSQRVNFKPPTEFKKGTKQVQKQ